MIEPNPPVAYMARETYERMLSQPRDASEVRMIPLPGIFTQRQSMTPAATRYTALLLDLIRLERAGQNDSPEADALRDEMDSPWYAATDAEREFFRFLSEAITDDVPLESVDVDAMLARFNAR